MEVIIATHNQGKLSEFKSKLEKDYPDKIFLSLKEINFHQSIEEFGNTFEQNALIKAQTISKKFPNNIVIADDSGLEVDCLSGLPGVFSARYAQDTPEYAVNQDQANIDKLLTVMKDQMKRSARFITVLCIIVPGKEPLFISGTVTGEILHEAIGTNGFGYDPIFSNNGIKSFGQITEDQKELISHRSNAINKLIELKLLGS